MSKRQRLATTPGRIKRIHVSQANIKHNSKAVHDDQRAPFTVQTSSGPIQAWRVSIEGPSALVWGDRVLSCGARAWVETTAALVLDHREGDT